MANNNGKITRPITITDLKQTLGESRNNLSYLCGNQHGKINKWSKSKPVKLASNNRNPRQSNWYKGLNYYCGFKKMKESILKNYYINNTGWIYEPPTGGEASPYSMADFDGYNHYAGIPIESGIAANSALEVNTYINNNLRIVFRNYPVGNGQNALSINDFVNAPLNINQAVICIQQYNQNPVTNTSAVMEKEYVSDKKLTSTYDPIIMDLNFSNTTGTKYLLFGIRIVENAQDIFYLPLPYNNGNHYMSQVNITYRTFTVMRVMQIGSGYITTMQDVNNFRPAGAIRMFKTSSDGPIEIAVRIDNSQNSNVFRIGNQTTTNQVKLKVGTRSGEYTGELYKVGGSAVSSYNVPAGGVVEAFFRFTATNLIGYSPENTRLAFTWLDNNRKSNTLDNIDIYISTT